MAEIRTGRFRGAVGFIGFCLAIEAFLFLFSCKTIEFSPAAPGRMDPGKKSSGALLVRSEDFVIYRLEDDDGPAMLAERFLGDPNKFWIVEEANKGATFGKGRVVVIPLKEENKGGLYSDGYQLVPVLCYHRFSQKCASALCTSARLFEQQMKYLKDNGYSAITTEELLDFLMYRRALPKRSVVLTVDGGYRSTYEIVYPILKSYGFKAVFFVSPDFVESSRNTVTWDQLREMKQDGFEIGSQTLSHCDLTKKLAGEDGRAYETRVKREIVGSKETLDKMLGQDTVVLSYPYGAYDPVVLNLCELAGYRLGMTLKRGGNPFFADPLALRRNQILKKDMKHFVESLDAFHSFLLR